SRRTGLPAGAATAVHLRRWHAGRGVAGNGAGTDCHRRCASPRATTATAGGTAPGADTGQPRHTLADSVQPAPPIQLLLDQPVTAPGHSARIAAIPWPPWPRATPTSPIPSPPTAHIRKETRSRRPSNSGP